MPSSEALELAELIMGMPRDKRAKAYKEAIDNGVVFDFEPADTEAFVKAVGAFTPEIPKLPDNRAKTLQTVYGPTGPTSVLNLGPAQQAAKADIEKIAAAKPRSLNPMDWITSGGKSPIPALVEGGANFLAGAKDEFFQGKPGPWQQRLLAALARGGMNVAAGGAMNAATGREPEAGSAHNLTNLLVPSLPGAKGVGLNALATGGAQGADSLQHQNTIDKVLAGMRASKAANPNAPHDAQLEQSLLNERQNTHPTLAGMGAAALSGGIGGALQGIQAGVRAGKTGPAAREDLAATLAKGIPRQVTPGKDSAKTVIQNAQDLDNLSPDALKQLKNYAPKSLINPSVRNKDFDDIIARTDFDIRAMSKKEWDVVKKTAKETPDQLYDKVIEPIFSAGTYTDLAKAAKRFNKNVTDVATIAGKDRAATLKDVRAKFVARLFEDNDVAGTGQIVNPDSLRYRVEAIGPDMFNQIFSDSPSPKSQASGAYDAFKTVIDLAEKGSRTNAFHDLKVFITSKGPSIVRIPFLGAMLETPLDQDAMFKGKNKGATMAAGAALGMMSPASAVGLGGIEIAEYSWDKFFDTFAKKNSRTLPILKALTAPDQNYSRTSIDRAIQTMFDHADKVHKRNKRNENWPEGATQIK